MDAGTIRGIGTLALLLSFVVLCVWAWLPSQKRRFDEAANLPFLGDDPVAGPTAGRNVR
jgi:cytochrome c oxidase cbb3-type subunit 4